MPSQKNRLAEVEEALRLHVEWVENLFADSPMLHHAPHQRAVEVMNAAAAPVEEEATSSGS